MRFCFAQFFGLLLFASNSTGAQNNGVVVSGKWPSQVFISDVNGRPFESRFDDVSGTPYFNADYKYGDITLKQGRKFVQVKMKINLVTQETIFVSANGIEGYMEAGMVKEITYADTTAEGIRLYHFQTGFPAVDRQTDKHFYQVLAAGRCSLLRSVVKKVIERRNELSGEVAKEFESVENIYIYVKGEMKRYKKDKDSLLPWLADKQEEMNQYMAGHKINFKNLDQVIQLLNYYHSL
ncbi:MAG: hypothetical protein HYU70_00195 [Bacteroidetes bacterium]|nr:hypothetical protein [Bacteroidota bacterium]